ncbi:MAG: DUF5675 family protein [Bacteroidota bacterium]
MKRFFIILIVALTTVAVLLLLYNPDLLEKVWLWIVGLIGTIAAFLETANKSISKTVKQVFNKDKNSKKEPPAYPLPDAESLYLLRLHESSGIILGNLFYKGSFFSFGLESQAGHITEGTYRLVIAQNREAGEIYQRAFHWFKGHIGIQNGNEAQAPLIHIGGLRTEPPGSILLTTELNPETALKDPDMANTYRRLYLELTHKIKQGIPVQLVVKNKNWFTDKFN